MVQNFGYENDHYRTINCWAPAFHKSFDGTVKLLKQVFGNNKSLYSANNTPVAS